MKVLDLFSGIGGFSLGLERAGMTTVAFCEVDPWCRRVLAKHWPDVPCHDDVRGLREEDVGAIDLICGGYPCQPFSQAGKRQGQEDERHLWPEMHRLVASIRPRWIVAENVAGHISMGLDDVLSDLEGEGYTCWPIVIPACAVDAPHRRDRVWIVGHAKNGRRSVGQDAERKGPENQQEQRLGVWGEFSGPSETVANASHARIYERREPGHAEEEDRQPRRMVENGVQGRDGAEREAVANANYTGREQQRRPKPIGQEHAAAQRGCRWLPEPGVGRVAHGIPKRVDRLKGLGNAVVPQIPEMIGRAIMAVEDDASIDT